MVADDLGRLYNKESVVKVLLEPKAFGDGEAVAPHITSLKVGSLVVGCSNYGAWREKEVSGREIWEGDARGSFGRASSLLRRLQDSFDRSITPIQPFYLQDLTSTIPSSLFIRTSQHCI